METVNDKETIYSTDPLVKTLLDIITPEECQHMIDISIPRMKQSLVSSSSTGVISSGRTSMNTWIPHNHDTITKQIGEKIAKEVGMPLENAESFQVIYYDKDGEYRNHYDSWVHDGSEKTMRCMRFGGARMKTALCYLNNVESGGGTKMTKMNISIPPEKGKLLIFDNTISMEDHTRHPLSEHAGMPVIQGEKYAFNLWFKECNSRRLYKDFNPSYYEIADKSQENEATVDPLNMECNTWTTGYIASEKGYVSEIVTDEMVRNCNFNGNHRRDGWLKLSDFPALVEQLEKTTGIGREFYENINVVEYKENVKHDTHFTAYNLDSDTGKKYTARQGQRMFTISMSLCDDMTIEFPVLNKSFTMNKGEMLFYNNITYGGTSRNANMSRKIVCSKGTGYLANIYIRYKDTSGKFIHHEPVSNNPVVETITENENYTNTLNQYIQTFEDGNVDDKWRGIGSLTYNLKGSFKRFSECMEQYCRIRKEKFCFNQKHLEIGYTLEESLPLQVIDDVLDPEVLDLIQTYYRESITNNTWQLGDKQSNRYKAHNEPVSRIIHYELLPLIEKIVGKPMKPTYTYLSAYVKGAELPPHTDRKDCEYTVSFIIEKPKDCNWNIYLHTPQQPIKHKGRYDMKPPIDECIGVDCKSGGLMLFQGTDHIHFREPLEGDFYNIVLLHYASV